MSLRVTRLTRDDLPRKIDWSVRPLVLEDLHHELCLDLIHFVERRLQSWPVFEGGLEEHPFEANG